MTSASAPGKIILFGEHAVVYGRPALAVPVTQVQATATIAASSRTGTWIEAPDIGLSSDLSHLPPDHPLAAVIHNTFSTLSISSQSPIAIHITSTIPVASGLGSGAAVSVAVIRALSEFFHSPLNNEQVNAIAYEVEKLHHGTPSGIDNTVITYAKPVYFVKLPSPTGGGAGGEVQTFHVGAPFTIVIADTGIPAPTKESVGDVRKLWETDKGKWEKVFDEIEAVVNLAKEKIKNGEWTALGPLMDMNHALLQTLTVSSVELDRLVEAGRRSGALGAKMSGGGRGGNMIALVRPEQAEEVAQALRSEGAIRTIITTIR
jgi:mevalonate kinase